MNDYIQENQWAETAPQYVDDIGGSSKIQYTSKKQIDVYKNKFEFLEFILSNFHRIFKICMKFYFSHL